MVSHPASRLLHHPQDFAGKAFAVVVAVTVVDVVVVVVVVDFVKLYYKCCGAYKIL